MQKIIEYNNYVINTDPDYKLLVNHNDINKTKTIYFGDFKNYNISYDYNYNEYNILKYVDINSYLSYIFREHSNNDDFSKNLKLINDYILSELYKQHLDLTFDYYTTTYNFLRYNYLGNINNDNNCINNTTFSYIQDFTSYEYNLSYINYCDYLQSLSVNLKDEYCTPFYIKSLNGSEITINLSYDIDNCTYEFEYSFTRDGEFTYTYDKDKITFNDCCYIKNYKARAKSIDESGGTYIEYDNSFLNISATYNYEFAGNILSLLGESYMGIISYNEIKRYDKGDITLTYFKNLCYNMPYLYKTDKLIIPIIEPGAYMYENMFMDCKDLTYGPVLFFQNIANETCTYMFKNCTNLSYLTLLTYNYNNNETNSNVIDSKMFNGWVDGVNNLNLTVNSNILNFDSYNLYLSDISGTDIYGNSNVKFSYI